MLVFLLMYHPPPLKIIGFGAYAALTNPYKGWTYLQSALQIVSQDTSLDDIHIEVIVFGCSYNKEIVDAIPFHVHFLGNIYDERALVMAYNGMDVFVVPSLAEAFGQTVLESLACNTPVVGFTVGGIPDMVNAHTGYLAEYKNSEDLARGIALLLKQEKRQVSEYVASFMSDVIVDKHRRMWDTD